MRFVLAANESIGYECLKILLEEEQDIVGVVTDKRNEGSPWKNLRIKRLAEENDIQIYQPKSINDPEFLDLLRKLEPDIIFNIAFIQIYKAPVLNLPRIGCVNFHPGPLPRYGGLNPWVWAIINNEREYGITLHYMKEKVDAGEILRTVKFPIAKDETGISLLMKCYKQGAALFREVVRDMTEDKISSIPQDLTQRTYYLTKVPFGGFIDIGWNAAKIERFVRAMTFAPIPNPYSPPMVRFNGNDLIITKAEVMEQKPNKQEVAGRVIRMNHDGVIMRTEDGQIKLNLSDKSNPKSDWKELSGRIGISVGSILGDKTASLY